MEHNHWWRVVLKTMCVNKQTENHAYEFPSKIETHSKQSSKIYKLDGSEEKIVQLHQWRFFFSPAHFQMEGMMELSDFKGGVFLCRWGWGPHLPKNSWENGIKLSTYFPCCFKMIWGRWKWWKNMKNEAELEFPYIKVSYFGFSFYLKTSAFFGPFSESSFAVFFSPSKSL